MDLWKPEYAIVFFLVLAGAVFRFANSKNEEGLTNGQRVISFLVGALFGSLLLVGVVLVWWKWNVFLALVGAIPLGIQSEKFLRLWLAYGQEADGLLDFISRMKVAYNAAKNDSTKTVENDQKP
jgi:glucan phosphoethanolaminetransferase (alkaline phosphatase superfamily)